MLHLAAGVAEELRLRLFVASVDHGLRTGSADECRLVERAAETLSIPCAVLGWQGEKPTVRLQEQARAARYALLIAEARSRGASRLLTAHTLDDQAETILFRMARGSGIDGLAGMRGSVPRSGIVLERPLLGVPKARLVATCEARGIANIADPSNADPRFARVRHRALLPSLAAEGLDAARFAQLSVRMARASDALERRAREVYGAIVAGEAKRLVLDAARLSGEPAEIGVRVLRLAIGRHIEAADPVSDDDRFPLLRLSRLEALSDRLQAAARRAEPLAATLGGLSFRLDAAGTLSIAAAPPRRRRLSDRNSA